MLLSQTPIISPHVCVVYININRGVDYVLPCNFFVGVYDRMYLMLKPIWVLATFLVILMSIREVSESLQD